MEAPERSRPADRPDARRKPGGAKGTVGLRRKRRRRPGRTRGIPWVAGGLVEPGPDSSGIPAATGGSEVMEEKCRESSSGPDAL